MPKCVFEDRQSLNQKVLDGVNKLADNVAATLISQKNTDEYFSAEEALEMGLVDHII